MQSKLFLLVFFKVKREDQKCTTRGKVRREERSRKETNWGGVVSAVTSVSLALKVDFSPVIRDLTSLMPRV